MSDENDDTRASGNSLRDGQLTCPMLIGACSGSFRAKTVVCGDNFVLITDTKGSLWSFGSGADGCLGHGDDEDRMIPTRVEAFHGDPIVEVSAGSAHAVALVDSGKVYSWGYNDGPILGHGEKIFRGTTTSTKVSACVHSQGCIHLLNRDRIQTHMRT